MSEENKTVEYNDLSTPQLIDMWYDDFEYHKYTGVTIHDYEAIEKILLKRGWKWDAENRTFVTIAEQEAEKP